MTIGSNHSGRLKAALGLAAAPLALAACHSPGPTPTPPPADVVVTTTTTSPTAVVVTSAPPGLPPLTVSLPESTLPPETTLAPPETTLAAPETTLASPETIPPPPPETSQPPATLPPKVQQLIDVSLAQEGKPYVFAAAGPDRFDCSGLVWYSLDQAGVDLPRLSAEGDRQLFRETPVAPEELQPGDLLFFWSANDRGIPKGHATHVEIYAGFGYAMGTDNEKEGARLEPVNWKTFIGAERVPDLYT